MAAADEQVVDELFVSAARTVDALVTSTRQKGHAIGRLAVVLERRFDGKARAACVDRADLIARIGNDRVVELLAAAGEDHIPVVLFVEAEGFVVVGIRRWSPDRCDPLRV